MTGSVTVMPKAQEREHRVSAPMAVGSNAEPDHDAVGPASSPSFARLGTVAGFLLTGLPLAIFWFVVLAAPILLGAFLAAIWVVAAGLILLILSWAGRPQRQRFVRGLALICAPLTLLSVRGAQAERRRIASSLGYRVSSPYRRLPRGPTLESASARAEDPAVWRDLAYLLLLLPVGAAEFVGLAAALVALAGTITLPAWLVVAFPEGVPLWQQVRIDTLPETLTVAIVALPVAALSGYLVIAGLSRAHVALGRALLGPSRGARLAERVEELTESRSRVLAAALAERRRIERDLHDGAQQRLVTLAMELGMAKTKMATDPAAARSLLEEAHGEAKRALADIRDLVRGIHPALLSDRGLEAAISALADRCPVQIEVDVDLDGRPPEAVETTACFVVAEALANVAKHSGAKEARITVRREPHDRLVIEVIDDGRGGADSESGTGLAGLRDRLAALDGRLFVESPSGGPTRVRAELPLGLPDGTARRTP
jgi:signal transduction histidine kinase